MNIGFYIPIEPVSGGNSKGWKWLIIISFITIFITLIWAICQTTIPQCYHCNSTNISKSEPYYKPWPHDDMYIDYKCNDCGRAWDELAK
jgi:hypothetical protein